MKRTGLIERDGGRFTNINIYIDNFIVVTFLFLSHRTEFGVAPIRWKVDRLLETDCIIYDIF